jgi:hypothetical protein
MPTAVFAFIVEKPVWTRFRPSTSNTHPSKTASPTPTAIAPAQRAKTAPCRAASIRLSLVALTKLKILKLSDPACILDREKPDARRTRAPRETRSVKW